MPESRSRNHPLSEFRALDLTDDRGYLCGKILADLGMDVIKVESPQGDPGRHKGPFYHEQPGPENSLFWWAYNTSKRSITLDLAATVGRAQFLELVAASDFVIESFVPGYLGELGLDYENLRKANPKIILVSISAFGQNGPYARYKAPDIVCMAMGGYMNLTGTPDRAPLRISVPQAYLHAASEAATAAMIALWYRERSGVGQWIDISVQECLVWETFSNHLWWEFTGLNPSRANAREGSGLHLRKPPPQMMFPCKDGHVLFQMFLGQHGYRTNALVDRLDKEGMADELLKQMDWQSNVLVDPTRPERDKEKYQTQVLQARERFGRFFLTKTKRELFDLALSTAQALAPVNSIADLLADPHLKARGFWVTVEHPELATQAIYPGAPFVASDMHYCLRRKAPMIGEDNAAVLGRNRWHASHQAAVERGRGEDSDEVFKGLRVLEFTWVTVGPRAARYFADHGAAVIKVEAPERPDLGRTVEPFRDDVPEPDRSGWYSLYNVNKLGITIDLHSSQGKALAMRLAQWADVLIESFRPGVMQRLGLDYDALSEVNPRLIYASTSMLGQSGPSSQFGGFGHHAAAMTGFTDLTGWPDRQPAGVFWAYTDHIAPQFLVTAIVAALLRREVTGKGQYIEQSQNEAALQFLAPWLLEFAVNGKIRTRDGNRDPDAAPHGCYRCAGEDRWCVIAVYTDQEWRSLCQAIGDPSLADDPKFATVPARKQHEDELDHIIEAWTTRLVPETVMHALQSAGVAAGIVSRAEDLDHDPQLRLRRHYLTFEHPAIGRHQVDALPFRLSKTPAKQYRHSPCLGEHNVYVCKEILGLSDEEYIELVTAGTFG